MRGLVLYCIVIADKFPSSDLLPFSDVLNDKARQYGLVLEINLYVFAEMVFKNLVWVKFFAGNQLVSEERKDLVDLIYSKGFFSLFHVSYKTKPHSCFCGKLLLGETLAGSKIFNEIAGMCKSRHL